MGTSGSSGRKQTGSVGPTGLREMRSWRREKKLCKNKPSGTSGRMAEKATPHFSMDYLNVHLLLKCKLFGVYKIVFITGFSHEYLRISTLTSAHNYADNHAYYHGDINNCLHLCKSNTVFSLVLIPLVMHIIFVHEWSVVLGLDVWDGEKDHLTRRFAVEYLWHLESLILICLTSPTLLCPLLRY